MPALDLKFLEGPHIHLRPLTMSDADGAYPTWLNQEAVCFGNSHHDFPYSREAAYEYIEACRNNRDRLILAIAVNSNLQHIGNIALQGIHAIHRSAEISILLGERDYWGLGYGKEAFALLLAHGFNSLNLRRITCGTFDNNPAMQKIALSLGFKEEGLRRQAVYKQGRYLDVHEYGLLAEEFCFQFSKEVEA